RPSPCSPKAWAAHTQHCYFVLLYVASNTVAAKEAPFKPESGHYVSCVARTSRTTRRRAPQEIDSHQIFRPTLARPRTAGGLTLPAGILEALEQPLEIFELQRLPRGLAQAPAQLLEDLSRALDVDLVGHLDAHSGIGTLRALRRPPHGIQLATRVAETVARRHPAQHLLRHLPRTLPQLLERTRLLLGGTVEIALAQCALRALHGLARTTELARRIETEVVEAPLQAAQHVAQLALPIPQRTQLLITRTIALALALPLALLTLTLALLALPPLAALPLLTTVALAALLVERIVEQLLLAAEQVAELVHHLAEELTLALVGHAAGLQPVEQIAKLAHHLLGHVAVARARHVLQVAQHLLQKLGRHELAVAVEALHRRLVLRLSRQLLEKLGERLPQLLHQPLDLLVGGALLQGLRQALLRSPQCALRVREVAVLDAYGDV